MYGCRPGDSIDIHHYHFVFNGVRNIVGPNWTGGEGIIAVTRNGRPEATLYAEKRFYTASRMMMTEAAISGGADPAICTPRWGRAERRLLGGASVL